MYAASEFAGFNGPRTVTGIAFRPDADGAAPFTHECPNVEVVLSTTSAAPNNLSTTFDDNVGSDATVVKADGPFTVSTAATGPAQGPKDFDVTIPIGAPFDYDPSAGNLLVDVFLNDVGPSSGSLFLDYDASTPDLGRVACALNPGCSFVTGLADSGAGLVTRFTFAPEPSGAVPVLAALAALAAVVRLRRADL